MNENQNTLAVIDGETLMDMDFPATKFCVETLLPHENIHDICPQEEKITRDESSRWERARETI